MSDTQYFKVRLLFSKTGPAAYISHLDLMKTFQRAFRRAGLDVRYSQGFNPHIYLSILAPISTGFESRGDVCDMELLEPMEYGSIVDRLNATLPAGLSVQKAGPPGKKPADIAFSRYEIRYSAGDAVQIANAFDRPLQVEKRSKRGSKPVDIRDYIPQISFEQAGGQVLCSALVRAGSSDPLNPVYITRALAGLGLLPQGVTAKYTRVELLDEMHQNFF